MMLETLKSRIKRRPTLLAAARRVRVGAAHTGFAVAQALAASTGRQEIIVVFGMRRSGNHLAITWLLEQTDGCAVFYNNIDPTRHPETARMKEFRLRLPNRSPRMILSYEDVSVMQLMSGPLPEVLETASKNDIRVTFALILRDPFNLFASRIKKWPERFGDTDALEAQMELYREHAALAGSPRPIWRNTPLVPVLYNELVLDEQKRSDIAGALGVRAGDRGLESVPVYGHGSSFGGMRGRGNSLRREAFLRWREMEHDPTLQEIISDPEMQEIARSLFHISLPEVTS